MPSNITYDLHRMREVLAGSRAFQRWCGIHVIEDGDAVITVCQTGAYFEYGGIMQFVVSHDGDGWRLILPEGWALVNEAIGGAQEEPFLDAGEGLVYIAHDGVRLLEIDVDTQTLTAEAFIQPPAQSASRDILSEEPSGTYFNLLDGTTWLSASGVGVGLLWQGGT